MDLELRGRTAIVTGCSVGIGREVARVLAAEGVSALVVARRGELLKTLQDEIETAGWVRPHALAIDLADRAAAARVRDEALARLGRRSEVIAIEVVDRRELRLPDVGLLVIEDPETGRQRTIDTSDDRFRVRLAGTADNRRQSRRTAIQRTGATHLRLRTDEEWTSPLAACLDQRRRVRALGRHAGSRTVGAAR